MSGKSLRFLRVALLALGGLLALLLAFRWEESWRAARRLAEVESELRRSGEKLDYRDFVPPPVPDEQNFAAAPIMVKLLRLTKPDAAESDPEGRRLQAMNLSQPRNSHPVLSRGDVVLGREVDLEKWSQYLRNAQSSPNEDSNSAAKEVLQWFAQWEPEMSEVAAAADRPFARFPVQYEKGMAVDLSHANLLLRLSRLYSLRATAALRAGDTALAYRDLQTLFRLQRALQSEPLLISELVRITIIAALEQPLWEGLVRHAWNAEQLRDIQGQFKTTELLAHYRLVIRGERAFDRLTFATARERRTNLQEKISALLPLETIPDSITARIFPEDAILNQNEATCERWVQDFVLPTVDVPSEKILRTKSDRLEQALKADRPTPYNFISKIMLPIYGSVARRIGSTAVALDEAQTACAIERFRFANGRVPEELKELVPAYLTKVPADVVSSNSLHYLRAPDGSYRLYSVGWNQTDDGGTIALKPGRNRRDDEKGDWVWLSAPR
jgi:hypothetical protein